MSVTDKLSSGGSSTWSALQFTQFRWLLAGNFAFFVGMQGQMLTRSVLAWELSGDEMALAYINMAFALPMILFAALGGALTDRYERRTLAQLAQFVLLLNEAAILLLLILDKLVFWHLLLAGVIGGAVIPLLMSSRTALVFNVVGVSLLGNATALMMSAVNTARVLGPMLMGAIIARYNATMAYLCASILFLIAWACLFAIDKKPVEPSSRATLANLLGEIREGVSYIHRTPAILSCLLFSFLLMSLVIPVQNLFILFTDKVWLVGEGGLGILMAVAGIGGVLGSFWVATRGDNNRRTRLMVFSSLAFAICLAAFSLSPYFYLALLPLAVANLFASASQTLNNTMLQLIIEDSQRGRASSFMMLTFGFTPLAVLPLAWMAKGVGIQWSVFIASAGLFAALFLMYRYSPTLRAMDSIVTDAVREHSKKPLKEHQTTTGLDQVSS